MTKMDEHDFQSQKGLKHVFLPSIQVHSYGMWWDYFSQRLLARHFTTTPPLHFL